MSFLHRKTEVKLSSLHRKGGKGARRWGQWVLAEQLAGRGVKKQGPVAIWQYGASEVDACLPGQVEEGGQGDAAARGAQTGGVLLVGLGSLVTGIEAAEPVEVGSSLLAQSFGQGKAQVAPLLVGGGYVGASPFYAVGNEFHPFLG